MYSFILRIASRIAATGDSKPLEDLNFKEVFKEIRKDLDKSILGDKSLIKQHTEEARQKAESYQGTKYSKQTIDFVEKLDSGKLPPVGGKRNKFVVWLADAILKDGRIPSEDEVGLIHDMLIERNYEMATLGDSIDEALENVEAWNSRNAPVSGQKFDSNIPLDEITDDVIDGMRIVVVNKNTKAGTQAVREFLKRLGSHAEICIGMNPKHAPRIAEGTGTAIIVFDSQDNPVVVTDHDGGELNEIEGRNNSRVNDPRYLAPLCKWILKNLKPDRWRSVQQCLIPLAISGLGIKASDVPGILPENAQFLEDLETLPNREPRDSSEKAMKMIAKNFEGVTAADLVKLTEESERLNNIDMADVIVKAPQDLVYEYATLLFKLPNRSHPRRLTNAICKKIGKDCLDFFDVQQIQSSIDDLARTMQSFRRLQLKLRLKTLEDLVDKNSPMFPRYTEELVRSGKLPSHIIEYIAKSYCELKCPLAENWFKKNIWNEYPREVLQPALKIFMEKYGEFDLQSIEGQLMKDFPGFCSRALDISEVINFILSRDPRSKITGRETEPDLSLTFVRDNVNEIPKEAIPAIILKTGYDSTIFKCLENRLTAPETARVLLDFGGKGGREKFEKTAFLLKNMSKDKRNDVVSAMSFLDPKEATTRLAYYFAMFTDVDFVDFICQVNSLSPDFISAFVTAPGGPVAKRTFTRPESFRFFNHLGRMVKKDSPHWDTILEVAKAKYPD